MMTLVIGLVFVFPMKMESTLANKFRTMCFRSNVRQAILAYLANTYKIKERRLQTRTMAPRSPERRGLTGTQQIFTTACAVLCSVKVFFLKPKTKTLFSDPAQVAGRRGMCAFACPST